MRRFMDRLQKEEGLTLVELLAGLLLFSTVITMLYGVLQSGYSLKNKITTQTTLRNHADVLVNQVLQSLKDMDEVVDVTEYFRQRHIEETTVPSAIWMTELLKEGTQQQQWVHYLLYIQSDPSEPTRYHLIREKYLKKETTIRDTTLLGGSEAPDERIQLDDPAFPLATGSKISVVYYEGYDVQSVLDISINLPKKDGSTEPYQFHSRINVN